MKKISLFFLIFMLMALPGAATLCDISAEEPIRLMEAEMKRGFKTYKKQKPSIYYLSYYITSGQCTIGAKIKWS